MTTDDKISFWTKDVRSRHSTMATEPTLKAIQTAMVVRRSSSAGLSCRARNQATETAALIVPCAAHRVRLTSRAALLIRVSTWVICKTKRDAWRRAGRATKIVMSPSSCSVDRTETVPGPPCVSTTKPPRQNNAAKSPKAEAFCCSPDSRCVVTSGSGWRHRRAMNFANPPVIDTRVSAISFHIRVPETMPSRWNSRSTAAS